MLSRPLANFIRSASTKPLATFHAGQRHRLEREQRESENRLHSDTWRMIGVAGGAAAITVLGTVLYDKYWRDDVTGVHAKVRVLGCCSGYGIQNEFQKTSHSGRRSSRRSLKHSGESQLARAAFCALCIVGARGQDLHDTARFSRFGH